MMSARPGPAWRSYGTASSALAGNEIRELLPQQRRVVQLAACRGHPITQRAQLLKGQRVQGKTGEKSTYEIDLGQNAEQKQNLVFFSCCTSEGKRYFKNIEAVRAAPSRLPSA